MHCLTKTVRRDGTILPGNHHHDVTGNIVDDDDYDAEEEKAREDEEEEEEEEEGEDVDDGVAMETCRRNDCVLVGCDDVSNSSDVIRTTGENIIGAN